MDIYWYRECNPKRLNKFLEMPCMMCETYANKIKVYQPKRPITMRSSKGATFISNAYLAISSLLLSALIFSLSLHPRTGVAQSLENLPLPETLKMRFVGVADYKRSQSRYKLENEQGQQIVAPADKDFQLIHVFGSGQEHKPSKVEYKISREEERKIRDLQNIYMSFPDSDTPIYFTTNVAGKKSSPGGLSLQLDTSELKFTAHKNNVLDKQRVKELEAEGVKRKDPELDFFCDKSPAELRVYSPKTHWTSILYLPDQTSCITAEQAFQNTNEMKPLTFKAKFRKTKNAPYLQENLKQNPSRYSDFILEVTKISASSGSDLLSRTPVRTTSSNGENRNPDALKRIQSKKEKSTPSHSSKSSHPSFGAVPPGNPLK